MDWLDEKGHVCEASYQSWVISLPYRVQLEWGNTEPNTIKYSDCRPPYADNRRTLHCMLLFDSDINFNGWKIEYAFEMLVITLWLQHTRRLHVSACAYGIMAIIFQLLSFALFALICSRWHWLTAFAINDQWSIAPASLKLWNYGAFRRGWLHREKSKFTPYSCFCVGSQSRS